MAAVKLPRVESPCIPEGWSMNRLSSTFELLVASQAQRITSPVDLHYKMNSVGHGEANSREIYSSRHCTLEEEARGSIRRGETSKTAVRSPCSRFQDSWHVKMGSRFYTAVGVDAKAINRRICRMSSSAWAAIYRARCTGHFRLLFLAKRFGKQARHVAKDLGRAVLVIGTPRRL